MTRRAAKGCVPRRAALLLFGRWNAERLHISSLLRHNVETVESAE